MECAGTIKIHKQKLICLAFALTAACSSVAPVSVPQVPSEAVSTAALEVPASPTVSLQPQLDASVTLTPPSNLTNSTAPTLTAVFTAIPDVTPIQFAPNETYKDLGFSITDGNSKTFVVSAVKGQIMAVSFVASQNGFGNSLLMDIKGSDGTIICPLNPIDPWECASWRGKLPSTQDYLITLTAKGSDADIKLRIVLNPQGVAEQHFTYQSQNQHASLTYTDKFAPGYLNAITNRKFKPEFVLNFIDSDFYRNTNLAEAIFSFGTSSDENSTENCTQPPYPIETIIGKENVNGVTFTRSSFDDTGAGNYFDFQYYRALKDGTCYEVVNYVHSTDPFGIKVYDDAALTRKFDAVLQSLVIR